MPYLRLTVKIFQFLRLSTKFLAVLRLSVNPIETLLHVILEFFFFFAFPKIWVGRPMGNETFYGNGLIDIRSNNNLPSSVPLEWFHDLRQPWTGLQSEYQAVNLL